MAPLVDRQRVMAKPLTLPDHRCVWPEHLMPVGKGSLEKETFDAWWSRNGTELRHLPPVLCEQWIHRHWKHSPFTFLPLDTLTWEERHLSGDLLLRSVHRVFGGS